MNLKDRKVALVSIAPCILVIIIFLLSGCSGKEGLIKLGKSGGPDGNPDLSQFISTIRTQPENPDSHYLLGGYHQQRGHHREAIVEFEKVISIDPEYVKAYNGLGVSYDLLGEFSDAIASYEAGLELDPKQAYLHNNLGYSYLMQGNLNQAISSFQKAVSLSPGEPRFHNNLASAYAENGRYEPALEQFLRGGSEAQAYLNMTEIYLHKGLYTEAGHHYVAALRLDPSKTLARTDGKTADTLVSIFSKIRKNSSNAAVGAVVPQPLKAERGKATKAVSIAAEMNLHRGDPLAQAAARTDHMAVKSGIPANQRAEAYSNADGNGDANGQWNYEMKMAILQGKPISVRPEASDIGRVGAVAKNKESRPNIGIEVSNGNGVEGMAQMVGVYLGKNGYPVDRLTNSKPFNRIHTQIYYLEGIAETAQLIAEQLPTKADLGELKMMGRPSIRVKILLGKDMIRHGDKFGKTEEL